RPWLTFWQAEDIRNWEVEQVGERKVLTRVLMRDAKRLCVLKLERGNSSSPGSGATSGNDGTNATDGTHEGDGRRCVVELWAENEQKEWGLISTEIPLRQGQPLPFIPFV